VTESLTITDGAAEVVVLPERGASLAAYDYRAGGEPFPIFRHVEFDESKPFDLANINLMPWTNRVSGGGFTWDGGFIALERNVPGDKFPLHGNGFQLPWRIARQEKHAVRLTLSAHGPAAYRYDAEMEYALGGSGQLSMMLNVTNRGAQLPFGLGFHPYFTRTPETFLLARASRVTLQDSDYMPTDTIDVNLRPQWNFNTARRLPDAWINNDFDGWDGRARIEWRDRHVSCDISAVGSGRYLVYSAAGTAPFFCFEPVTHAVDAFNRAGGPIANGLVALEAGASMALSWVVAPRHERHAP
jgi:aldose 1-epimerase